MSRLAYSSTVLLVPLKHADPNGERRAGKQRLRRTGTGLLASRAPNGARRGRVFHRQGEPSNAIVLVECSRDRGSGGYETNLADSLGAEWSLRMCIFDHNQLHFGHVSRA